MSGGHEQRRETRAEWLARACMLAVGAASALALVFVFHARRVVPDDAALGRDSVSVTARFEGRAIAAYRLDDYAAVYGPGGDRSTGRSDVLWLGNSQMHSVNQYREGDSTAPTYAALALGGPVLCLSLPNASLQEHLAVFIWAIERRQPDTLILPLVYDDLREDELRPEFELIAEPSLIADLAAVDAPTGPRLARQLAVAGEESGAAIDAAGSLQERTEALLERELSERFAVWGERQRALAAVQLDLYRLRNLAFQLDASSQRKMIPVRYRRNMDAYRAILKVAAEREIDVLVYVAPLRWDIAPPYDLRAYRVWKEEVGKIAADLGARFADLDRLVPADQWGTNSNTGTVDFMHFRDGGHRLLGHEIARRLRPMRDGRQASADEGA